ncbi:uncharacterized protein LOC132268971 [Cornus florida]|uniref:uncharacterized protein LOC132268971 n=1 Tax=Cornus florida TaxID=4283 RepID=UPI002897B881|nr:uncharacterized protein LOC132268971 [Cornus florida]XP_059625899.1 uncharacterized protein LOC132268971 [Cornus florida]
MKRAMPWSDGEDDSSSDESSTLDTDTEASDGSGKNNTRVRTSKGKTPEVIPGKRKSRAIDFEALSRHGYKGGLSVLSVPPPKEVDDKKQDWSWSNGKDNRTTDTEESYQERQRTRAALVEGEQLSNALTQKEKKNLSFSQKEKRKRDIGQASRGKSYVEEEKRLLRDSGIYSGFDS